MVKIRVFITTREEDRSSVNQAKAIFDTDHVEIEVVSCNFKSNDNHDYEMVKKCLKLSDDESYTIICKDSSASTMPAKILIDHLHHIIKNDCFDIMWLANWLDQCQKYSNHRHVSKTGLAVVDTYSPHGIQCLMFSPEGRDKFLRIKKMIRDVHLSEYLNRSVKADRFKAITFQPCPISFDISKAEAPLDYVKTCQCADPPGPIHPDRPNSNINFFIFIVIGIFVFICINLLIKFGIYMSNHYDKLILHQHCVPIVDL